MMSHDVLKVITITYKPYTLMLLKYTQLPIFLHVHVPAWVVLWLVQYDFVISAVWHTLFSNNIHVATGYKYRVVSRGRGLYVIYTPRAGGLRLCKSRRDRYRDRYLVPDSYSSNI